MDGSCNNVYIFRENRSSPLPDVVMNEVSENVELEKSMTHDGGVVKCDDVMKEKSDDKVSTEGNDGSSLNSNHTDHKKLSLSDTEAHSKNTSESDFNIECDGGSTTVGFISSSERNARDQCKEELTDQGTDSGTVYSSLTSKCLTTDSERNEQKITENIQQFYPEIELSKAVSSVIQEGKAYIIKQSQNVFYNPVQEFNRDLRYVYL